MITRETAKQLAEKFYTPKSTYAMKMHWKDKFINAIYDSFEQRLCDNCNFDYCGCSIQDSILQVDPEATFTTFGCNSFEPKYRRTECAHAKQKNPF